MDFDMVEIPTEDIPQVYATVMLEIKDRMQACANALGRAIEANDSVQKVLEIEMSFLNLRRMTELLAIAVIAAHNREATFRSTDFTTQSHSDKLLTLLDKRGGGAFPIPVKIIESDLGIEFRPLSPRRARMAGTRDEIQTLYRECGKALHTVPLRHIVKLKRYRYSSRVVAQGMAHLTVLLEEHLLAFKDGKALLTRVGFGEDRPTWSMWIDLGEKN